MIFRYNLYISKYFEIFEGIASKMNFKMCRIYVYYAKILIFLYICKITPLNTYNLIYLPV